jgi:hypothetical protein
MLYHQDQIDLYNNKSQKIDNYITNFLLKKNKILVDISELKINDLILIDFIPDSQRYIYDLYSKIGTIVSIINNNVIINNIENENENLLHDGVSYLGQSLGYSYYIYKFI